MNYSNLSVVIPLYNKASTVRRAVKSVSEQLGLDDELLVVDDGSTDSSVDQIGDILSYNIKVIRQRNSGVASARNAGVLQANNEHVAFLDADDYWLPGTIAALKTLIQAFPRCVMYTVGHLRFPRHVDPISKLPLITQGMRSVSGIEFIEIYSRRQLINSSTSCLKKTHLLGIGGFPDGAKSGEDIYVWLRMALLGSVAYQRGAYVIVEREPTGLRAPRERIPFHYRWFLRDENLGSFSPASRVALKKFFFYRCISQSFGDIVSGNRRSALSKALLVGRAAPLIYLLVPVLSLVPRSFFKFALNIAGFVRR